VQAFAAVMPVLGSLNDTQVRDVLSYHVSATGVRLVSWNPTGLISTTLGIQTLELIDTR
jgi:hypothetical protein